ncbi:hypothetical protein MalM25_35890 [Planctomycetes bacterium MalM25]|nr:hypothetical protein MalM25_35890 [Planctomycetes bacterium MalM25]
MSDETLKTDLEATETAAEQPAPSPAADAPAVEAEAAAAEPDAVATEPASAEDSGEEASAEAEGDAAVEGDSAEGSAEGSAEDAVEYDADLEAAEAAMDDEEETLTVAPAGPIEELSDEEMAEDIQLDWYILKVQSNRERTSSEALKRKVAIEGIDNLFGEIIVPTEKVTEFKNGKKKTVQRKIWPGYIAVQMHVNDDTWFAIRETSGIGDFTGASGKPIPMSPEDVAKILPKEEGEEGTEEDVPKLNIKFAEGDKVKVTDGNFENFEGDVDAIDHQSGKVSVMISIFGRSTPVELEYWQVEKL